MKKIILMIIIGIICFIGVLLWIGVAWIITVFLSVYIYESFALYWFIISLVGLGYIFKSIFRVKAFKKIKEKWNKTTRDIFYDNNNPF